MIKLVVFDMAGTTVDEQNAVYRTVHAAITKGGYTVSWEKVLELAAGKEKRQAIEHVMTHILQTAPAPAIVDSIFAEFQIMLDAAYAAGIARPMPGAVETFSALREKGIYVALNTGYARPVAELLLNQLGWTVPHTIDMLVTASDVENGRPHPDMILAAMRHFQLQDARQVAKIGDSGIDIEEGKNAGCGIYAGITTGAQTEDLLKAAAPTHILHALKDIILLV